MSMKTVLKMSIPVTLSSILLPLSGLLDSVLVPRLLGAYAENAVTLYGLFSGGAVTVISLPVSICYGIAAASIPAVAAASAKKGENARGKTFYALFVTAAVSAPCAVGLYFLAGSAAKIIFRSLSGAELQILTALIRAYAVSAFTLSCTQTLSACLTAQGKPQYAAVSMLIAVVVKTVTYLFLLRNPKISVFGLAYATNLCYLVAFALDLVYNLYNTRRKKE